jgi:hypothetical protein
VVREVLFIETSMKTSLRLAWHTGLVPRVSPKDRPILDVLAEEISRANTQRSWRALQGVHAAVRDIAYTRIDASLLRTESMIHDLI